MLCRRKIVEEFKISMKNIISFWVCDYKADVPLETQNMTKQNTMPFKQIAFLFSFFFHNFVLFDKLFGNNFREKGILKNAPVSFTTDVSECTIIRTVRLNEMEKWFVPK